MRTVFQLNPKLIFRNHLVRKRGKGRETNERETNDDKVNQLKERFQNPSETDGHFHNRFNRLFK